MTATLDLKRTPLNQTHRACNAKMVDFGGWDMPVQYSGMLDEHHAVRKAVGLFDVSHMGEIEIRGPEACNCSTTSLPTTPRKLKTGQAHYSGAALRAWRFRRRHPGPQGRRPIIFSCASTPRIRTRTSSTSASTIGSTPRSNSPSARYAQLAIQGPQALDVLQKLTPVDLAAIRYYWFTDGEVSGTPARIARTGYTGEDGFEIYVEPRSGGASVERDSGRRPSRSASSPAAWAPAIRCVWKPRWRSTATRSTPPSLPGKPTWAGS